MINLLPDERKQTIRAGRSNRLLLRYVLLSAVFIVVLTVMFAVTWYYIHSLKSEAETEIAQSEEANQQIAKDLQKVTSFEQDLASAKQILGQEINYSEIILRYASAIPGGAIIDKIVLEPNIVGTPSTFVAKVKTSDDVLRLKNSLSESPYFDDVRFSEIARLTGAEDGYNYSVLIELSVNKALLEQGLDS